MVAPNGSTPSNGTHASQAVPPAHSAPPPILTATATVPAAPKPAPGPGSIVWKESPADALAVGEMSVSWSPTVQKMVVGADAYVHEGPSAGMLSSHAVARLLVAASAPNVAWRPAGDAAEVPLAELHTFLAFMLLEGVLASSMGAAAPERIPQDVLRAGEMLAPSVLGGLSVNPRDAIAKFFLTLDEVTFVRLSPVFFERRKSDQRAPEEPVAFRFQTSQSFEGSVPLQSQLAGALTSLREQLSRPKGMSDLSVEQLIFQAWGQPDPTTAIGARTEIIRRLRSPSDGLTQNINAMMALIADMYGLIKPSCVVCVRPGTGYWADQNHSTAYGCDQHRAPNARDLPGADAIRAAAFFVAQLAGQGPGAFDPGSVSNGSVV
jgi:hypothetical protein